MRYISIPEPEPEPEPKPVRTVVPGRQLHHLQNAFGGNVTVMGAGSDELVQALLNSSPELALGPPPPEYQANPAQRERHMMIQEDARNIRRMLEMNRDKIMDIRRFHMICDLEDRYEMCEPPSMKLMDEYHDIKKELDKIEKEMVSE
jgi:hypothetical protein